MIEKPSDLHAKKRVREQKSERPLSPESREILHDLLNQLTVINLCCFQFRAAENVLDPSLRAAIDRIETTIVDVTSLLAKLPQGIYSTSASVSSAACGKKIIHPYHSPSKFIPSLSATDALGPEAIVLS